MTFVRRKGKVKWIEENLKWWNVNYAKSHIAKKKYNLIIAESEVKTKKKTPRDVNCDVN